MSPETGRRFGPYEIQSRLGGGGMGHVYRAWDARLHREVAIKLLNHEFAMPGMRERFLREARAASALNHPNICSIFDIGEQDGDPYLVMELLEGETLKDRIQDSTISVNEMVSIARETAEALGAAHSKGVVHRDVKPANIFLVRRPNGTVQAKVLDFGLAKIGVGAAGARQRGSDLTSVGATVGTLAYMSPEQARGELLDSRSDLFSLGVVMYEMATRQVPFQGATSALVFVQLLNHPPEPVRDWNEAVPRDLEKIIFKLLAKERTARFQTANELEQALLTVLDKGGNGGWLRKAANAVPLVRAPDPVARSKRASAGRLSGANSPVEGAQGGTPQPGADPAGQGTVERVLRPVARVPRQDGAGVAQIAATAAAGTLSPAPSSRPASDSKDAEARPRQDAPRGQSEPTSETAGSGAKAPGSLGQVLIQPKRPLPEANGGSRQQTSSAERKIDGHAEKRLAPGSESRDLVLGAARESTNRDPRPGEFEDVAEPRTRNPSRAVLAVLGVAGLGVLAFLYHRSQTAVTLLNRGDAVAVTRIINQTGMRVLDDSVSEGLKIAMGESSWVVVRDQQSVKAAERQMNAGDGTEKNSLFVSRRAAERLGAKAYLAGTLTGSSPPFVLRVDLRDAKTNDVLASAEARAGSVEQVSGAIDQAAAELRAKAGEPRPSTSKTATTLRQEGSENLSALQLLGEAHGDLLAREPLAAVAALQQAVGLDAHFTQAYLELTTIYRRLHAETAAAETARLALASSEQATQRTQMLAQAAYEINATGDYLRATGILRQLVSTLPEDAEALSELADTLLLEGHLSEALQTAQQAYAIDPFAMNAYSTAEKALLMLDRYDAAFQLQSQLDRSGAGAGDETLVAAYLDNRPDIVAQVAATIPLGKMEYRPDLGYGLYLDNSGHLAAGASHWTSRANAALISDTLRSAGTYLLAQAAFDRALLGDCKAALLFTRGVSTTSEMAGRAALSRLGMTAALCGDTPRATQMLNVLEQQFPQSFELHSFVAPDIRAAIALHEDQPAEAINQLQAARPYDLISITPFLRGQAHVRHGEVEIGIVDLQTVLAHRGAAFVGGSSVYPAAEIGVARAFGGSGDLSNSAAAYTRFLELWRTGDAQSPLVAEARAHTTR